MILVNNRKPIRNILRNNAKHGFNKQNDEEFPSGDIFLSTQEYNSSIKFYPTQKPKYSPEISFYKKASTESP